MIILEVQEMNRQRKAVVEASEPKEAGSAARGSQSLKVGRLP